MKTAGNMKPKLKDGQAFTLKKTGRVTRTL